MKVYLDDVRETPNGWHRTYTAEETIDVLKTGQVTHLSLDHDLTPAHYNGALDSQTGYAVCLWLENEVMENPDFKMPEVTLHTMNPVGRKHMERSLEVIRQYIELRDNGLDK